MAKFWKFFSSDAEASSKRLLMLVLASVFIAGFFIILFLNRPVPNQDLADKVFWYLFLLILFFGGFITVEQWLSFLKVKVNTMAEASIQRARAGVPDVAVNQTVERQNITTTGETTSIKKEGKDEEL